MPFPVRNEGISPCNLLINPLKYHSILHIKNPHCKNKKSTNLMGMKNDYLDARISLGWAVCTGVSWLTAGADIPCKLKQIGNHNIGLEIIPLMKCAALKQSYLIYEWSIHLNCGKKKGFLNLVHQITKQVSLFYCTLLTWPDSGNIITSSFVDKFSTWLLIFH